jgi:hypothetical protein
MSDDKVTSIGVVAVLLGFFVFAAHGCRTIERNKLEAQRIRGNSPTVTTCVEHSVLDRIVVQQ